MKVKIAEIKWTIKDMEEVEKYQFFYEKWGIVGCTNGLGQKTLYEAIGSPTQLPTPEVQGVDSPPPPWALPIGIFCQLTHGGQWLIEPLTLGQKYHLELITSRTMLKMIKLRI